MSDRIVAEARRWLGTPYRHQAALRGAGCDCLGLVHGVWQAVSGRPPLELPKYRADWRDTQHAGELMQLAATVLRPADGGPRAGQVVLFRLGRSLVPRHCGIVTVESRFIHAQEGFGVVEANLTEGWRRRVAQLFDFPEL